MATTSVVLNSTNKILSDYEHLAQDYFHVDVGAGSTWTRLGGNVAGKLHPYGTNTTYWACPQTAIATTDLVRVTMVGLHGTGSQSFAITADTSVLGAPYLLAATWSFTRSAISYSDYDLKYTSDTTVTNISYGTPDTTAPVLSGTLAATAGDGQVTLSGPTASDANGIAKWQYRIGTGAWVDIASSANTTMPTTIVGSLTNGVEYSFTVRALDAAANASDASNAAVATPWGFLIYHTISDLQGTPLVRLRLSESECHLYDGSTWNVIATGLARGTMHDFVLDTHQWTISINGGTPVACEPLTLPVYPIGELKFEMTIGSEMYFGEIQYE